MPLDSAPMVELLELLRGAELSADMDPAMVNLPGCWLALDTVARANAAGQYRLACTLYLIAPDTDPQRAMDALGGLFDTVSTVLTPDGPVTSQGVVMPSDPTPLPALVVPVNLYTA